MKEDICQIILVNREKVGRVRENLPGEHKLAALADLFKVLGEPARVRILQALAREELCVCEIAAVVDGSSSAVSHQLRILRSARLVRSRKEGKMVFYALDDDLVRVLFEEGLRHLEGK